MKLLAHIAATVLGLNLGLVVGLWHAYRSEDRRRRDDLCALIDATAEPIPPVEVAHMERTPIADAAWLAAIDRACRIEVACEEWAAEVDALADVELAEMTREEGR